MTIRVEEIHLDNFKSENRFVLRAKEGRTVLGELFFSELHHVPAIQMIEVHPDARRRGIGALLVRHLVQMFPPYQKVLWGSVTEAGAALQKKMDAEYGFDRHKRAKINTRALVEEHGGKVLDLGRSRDGWPKGYFEFPSRAAASKFVQGLRRELGPGFTIRIDRQEHAGTVWLEAEVAER